MPLLHPHHSLFKVFLQDFKYSTYYTFSTSVSQKIYIWTPCQPSAPQKQHQAAPPPYSPPPPPFKPQKSTHKRIKTSIGGAGNFLPASTATSTSTSSSHPLPRSQKLPHSTGKFHSEISGFGNTGNYSSESRVAVQVGSVERERESWHVRIGGVENRKYSTFLVMGRLWRVRLRRRGIGGVVLIE